MRNIPIVSFALAAGVVGGCTGSSSDEVLLYRLDGAVFTTTVDGSRVDANIYELKTDVYLDGGPGANAPPGAAALPAGDYYFMVTDPSGKDLLSQDPITCRRFTINATGQISSVAPSGACAHNTGVDGDHGGLTVQLMPYADTPNPGGEYKAWVTSVGEYGCDVEDWADCDVGTHGFISSESKTDNYKVRNVGPVCPNGFVEGDEECDDGNTINGDGCSATCEFEKKEPCCGDGVREGDEECDDGNTTSGDGCSATCEIEEKKACCGDGIVEGDEECDDGNTTSGDGCSSTCQHEKYY